MLCYQHSENGEICTNRCPERTSCKLKNVPVLVDSGFLLLACDRLTSIMDFAEIDSIQCIAMQLNGIAPEGYINEDVYSNTY